MPLAWESFEGTSRISVQPLITEPRHVGAMSMGLRIPHRRCALAFLLLLVVSAASRDAYAVSPSPYPSIIAGVAPYEPLPELAGQLTFVESTALEPLMTAWTREFRELYKNVHVSSTRPPSSFRKSESSAAVAGLIFGRAQLAPTQDLLAATDIAAFIRRYGYEPTVVPVAIVGRQRSLSGDPDDLESLPADRYVYVYVNRAPDRPLDRVAEEFLKFVQSRHGQEIALKAGFAPLSAARRNCCRQCVDDCRCCATKFSV